MAYSDYGAFVWENGKRRRDKEDAVLLDGDRFGYYHGVMGDGPIRVGCYKQGFHDIYEINDDGIHAIKSTEGDVDIFGYGEVNFDYKEYHFRFVDQEPYKAEMIEPDNTHWECNYDYWYGAGFE